MSNFFIVCETKYISYLRVFPIGRRIFPSVRDTRNHYRPPPPTVSILWIRYITRASWCVCVCVYMSLCVYLCICVCMGVWGGGGVINNPYFSKKANKQTYTLNKNEVLKKGNLSLVHKKFHQIVTLCQYRRKSLVLDPNKIFLRASWIRCTSSTRRPLIDFRQDKRPPFCLLASFRSGR